MLWVGLIICWTECARKWLCQHVTWPPASTSQLQVSKFDSGSAYTCMPSRIDWRRALYDYISNTQQPVLRYVFVPNTYKQRLLYVTTCNQAICIEQLSLLGGFQFLARWKCFSLHLVFGIQHSVKVIATIFRTPRVSSKLRPPKAHLWVALCPYNSAEALVIGPPWLDLYIA